MDAKKKVIFIVYLVIYLYRLYIVSIVCFEVMGFFSYERDSIIRSYAWAVPNTFLSLGW